MTTMTTAAEAARACIEPREPRCRICRDPYVRRQVNQLLDWRGVPLHLEGRNKRHRITYTDILGWLEPINESRDKGDRITYDSLWVHAKRHYDLDGMTAYWESHMVKKLRHSLSRGA